MNREDYLIDYIKMEKDYWAIDMGERLFVFHALNGEPFIVEKSDLGDDYKNVEFEGIDDSVDKRKKITEVSEQYQKNYFGPTGIDLSVSEVCNLGCPMCFHNVALHNTCKRNITKLMSYEKAKEWIDYYIEYADEHRLPTYTFHIGSAEPFINKENLWKIISYIHQQTSGHPTDIFLNSNLTLIEEEDVLKIKKYGIHIFVGIDGLQQANDSTRVYKADGRGTFEDIIQKVKLLIKNGVEVGVNITLTNDNFEKVDAKETVDFFAELGIKSLLIDTDVVTHIKYNTKEIVDKLMDFTMYCDEKNMISYGSWRIPFNMLTAENSETEPKSFCAARTGKNIVVTPSKGITFCTYSSKIMTPETDSPKAALELYTEEVRKMMSATLPGKVEKCKGCALEGFCMGGCMLAHENHGENNYMCDIYLEATRQLVRYYYSNYEE
mgnify:FL=1